jgi:hypothetical protein
VIAGHLYVVRTVLTKPPKDKLAICVCAERNLFLWINTLPRPHGVAQMPLAADDHGALTRACHLDCSQVWTFLPHELAAAQDRGPIDVGVAARLLLFMQTNPPKTMTAKHLQIIVETMAALCG